MFSFEPLSHNTVCSLVNISAHQLKLWDCCRLTDCHFLAPLLSLGLRVGTTVKKTLAIFFVYFLETCFLQATSEFDFDVNNT